MKTFRLFLAAFGSALLLLSCYGVSTQTTGRIAFAVSSQARSITAGSNLLRVSLVSAKSVGGSWLLQSLYTFPGGSGYAQGSVGSTLTLDNIPVGNWAVLVSAGTTDASGNFVTTDYNWPYSVVSVAPGVDNPVSVTLQPSPVTRTSLFGVDVDGVANLLGGVLVGNFTYYVIPSTSTQLYGINATSFGALPGGSIPTGVSVNSLSSGWVYNTSQQQQQALFINTSTGIYYYYTGAPSVLGDLAASNPIPVYQSGAFHDLSVTGAPVAIGIFYQNVDGFGGAYINSTPYTSSMWVNVNLLNQTGSQPISDLTLTDNSATSSTSYAYYASKLGAFQIDQSVVTAGSANQGNLGVAKFFTVPDGSTILSLNAIGTGTSPFYIGSTSGGWTATLSEASTPPVVSPTKVAATQGDAIVKIASVSIVGAANYVAFLSRYNLYILNTSTQNVKVYPFSAGLPGQITGLAWSSTGPTLYVAGRSGPTGTPGLVSISGSGLP